MKRCLCGETKNLEDWRDDKEYPGYDWVCTKCAVKILENNGFFDIDG